MSLCGKAAYKVKVAQSKLLKASLVSMGDIKKDNDTLASWII